MNWKLNIVILVVVFVWWVNEPIPKGFSQPWKLRAMNAMKKVMITGIEILDATGILQLEDGYRAMFAAGPIEFPDNILVMDELIEGVQVRTYKPKNMATKDSEGYPALVYYHGGAWVMGSTYMYDPQILEIMNIMDILIFSVEYRLAPEHKFPIPLDDCIVVTKYVLNNARTLGADPKRVAIGGDSAGGNLAAAVGLKLRDEQFVPMPKQQILIYPILQVMDLTLPSYVQHKEIFFDSYGRFVSGYATGTGKHAIDINTNNHVIPDEKKRIALSLIRHEDIPEEFRYAPYQKANFDYGKPEIWNELKDIIASPYFSPLMAEDLTRLPDTYIYTSHYDCLRDDGILYAKRLRDAGIPVTHVHGENGLHGDCFFKDDYPVEGMKCLSNFVDYLLKL